MNQILMTQTRVKNRKEKYYSVQEYLTKTKKEPRLPSLTARLYSNTLRTCLSHKEVTKRDPDHCMG